MRDSAMSDEKSIRIDDDSSSIQDMGSSLYIPNQVQRVKKEDLDLDNSLNEEKEINLDSDIKNNTDSLKQNDNEEIIKQQKSNISSLSNIVDNNNNINNNSKKSSIHGNKISLNMERKKNVSIYLKIDKEKSAKEGYTIYEISIENKKSNEIEKKILCYRRYDNFNNFYEVLKIRYPHYIFPKLSPKKILAKVYDDKIFLELRKNELQYFLNEIFNHKIIGKSEEMKNFLNGKFDKQYFNSIGAHFDYSGCIKKINNAGLINQGVNGVTSLFNYFTGKKTQDNSERENTKKIFAKNEITNKKIEKYSLTLNELKTFHEALKEEYKESKFICNNLLFLKRENNNENDLIKKNFNNIIEINQAFNNEIYDEFLKFFENEIIYPLSCCILDLEGEKKAIERYNKFLVDYNNIINCKKKEDNEILEEQIKIKKDIELYEETLLQEIDRVEEKNNKIYDDIIHRLSIFLNNHTEITINKYKNSYFENNNI